MFVQEKRVNSEKGHRIAQTQIQPLSQSSLWPITLTNMNNQSLSDGMHQTEIRVSNPNPSLIWHLKDGQQRKLQANNSWVDNPMKGGSSYKAICQLHSLKVNICTKGVFEIAIL